MGINSLNMEKIVLVLALLLFCQISITIAADYNWMGSHCSNTSGNYIEGRIYDTNLKVLLEDLAIKSSSVKFNSSTVGGDPNQVYGLFQCREDISLNVCNECIKDATQRIILQNECPLHKESIVWYYECMLRFANRNIFSVPEIYAFIMATNQGNVQISDEFGPIYKKAMDGVIENASSSMPHFGYGEADFDHTGKLYTFAQCTPDIDISNCKACLKNALNQMDPSCCNISTSIMLVGASCYLSYSTIAPILNQTYLSSLAINQGPGANKKTSLSSAIYSAIGFIVILIVLMVVFWKCFWKCFRKCLCREKTHEVSYYVPSVSTSRIHDSVGGSPLMRSSHYSTSYESDKSDVESLGKSEFEQYDFATLRSATNDFSAKNELGKGGFGTVYKGTLENGDQLAIKRLSGRSSGQGTKEFLAEASLLAKLQHKNLVKLMGFCVEGDEKLLVYEFMSNGSLDGSLFDPVKRPLLDWTLRFKIIKGIARGLLYLHEDSRLTIIHRDLKPGNILLDKEKNAKIADFGLAKLFDNTQKFGNTSRIVGTMGYMAPEYLTTGEYSDKSDVYSFGIMILEIVSGQSNIKLYQSLQREDLPFNAWRLWNDGNAFDLVDPELSKKCSRKDVIRCTQIGLLCLQANPEQRPTMETVYTMLTTSIDLDLPSRPAMSFPQFNMPGIDYNTRQQSEMDNFSTKSSSQDLFPNPR